tara:strand:- start:989 stop:1471 length:483 start_codon:yes stop_codon:yes gene_type:complete
MKIKMKFAKYPRPFKKPWTKRRQAAAERAVQRLKDQIPLFSLEQFPEMHEFRDAEDRRLWAEFRDDAIEQSQRKHRAEEYWEIRRRLREFDQETQNKLIERWNKAVTKYHHGPTYFLGTLWRFKEGREDIDGNSIEQEYEYIRPDLLRLMKKRAQQKLDL